MSVQKTTFRIWRSINTTALLCGFFGPWFFAGCTPPGHPPDAWSGFRIATEGFLIYGFLILPFLLLPYTLLFFIIINGKHCIYSKGKRMWRVLSLSITICAIFLYISPYGLGIDSPLWGLQLVYVGIALSILLEILEWSQEFLAKHFVKSNNQPISEQNSKPPPDT